jgi:methylthioribose-1-phosphate isomerase
MLAYLKVLRWRRRKVYNQMRPINVRLRDDNRAVTILDQTLLPTHTVFVDLENEQDMFEAILNLRVRGAPAIGICAAFCHAVLANRLDVDSYDAFLEETKRFKARLESSRPTAVNLSWALNRMEKVVSDNSDTPVARIKELLIAEATNIQQEDMLMCESIARHGLNLLNDGDGVLTHCNAGPLATSIYGTALGPVIMAHRRGMTIHVFADETRPLLQGARITSYELQREGINVTLICDNMAGAVMKNGWVNYCFTGCDRIAANGDTANKTGTSAVAILAKYYGIPFYILGPSGTIDFDCATGDSIPIELRDPTEIKRMFFAEPVAPDSVNCYNPAFDVTDHSLISGIITEHGILRPPYSESLAALANRL